MEDGFCISTAFKTFGRTSIRTYITLHMFSSLIQPSVEPPKSPRMGTIEREKEKEKEDTVKEDHPVSLHASWRAPIVWKRTSTSGSIDFDILNLRSTQRVEFKLTEDIQPEGKPFGSKDGPGTD